MIVFPLSSGLFAYFQLFNFQRAFVLRQLVYTITSHPLCQHLFSTFFKNFQKFHILLGVSRLLFVTASLYYHFRYPFVNTFFSLFFEFLFSFTGQPALQTQRKAYRFLMQPYILYAVLTFCLLFFVPSRFIMKL